MKNVIFSFTSWWRDNNVYTSRDLPVKPATNDSREIREMWKTCQMREKGRARDNMKIDTHISRFDYFLIFSYN